jgi:hypothetical protein
VTFDDGLQRRDGDDRVGEVVPGIAFLLRSPRAIKPVILRITSQSWTTVRGHDHPH